MIGSISGSDLISTSVPGPLFDRAKGFGVASNDPQPMLLASSVMPVATAKNQALLRMGGHQVEKNPLRITLPFAPMNDVPQPTAST